MLSEGTRKYLQNLITHKPDAVGLSRPVETHEGKCLPIAGQIPPDPRPAPERVFLSDLPKAIAVEVPWLSDAFSLMQQLDSGNFTESHFQPKGGATHSATTIINKLSQDMPVKAQRFIERLATSEVTTGNTREQIGQDITLLLDALNWTRNKLVYMRDSLGIAPCVEARRMPGSNTAKEANSINNPRTPLEGGYIRLAPPKGEIPEKGTGGFGTSQRGGEN